LEGSASQFIAGFRSSGPASEFLRAAEELNITHGAVSRAIKSLEDQLDVLLFERATRSVRLTAVGEPCARAAAATAAATARHSTRY
jgi:LysR family transcriptional regulator, glycine cleavage system transcriptional activator